MIVHIKKVSTGEIRQHTIERQDYSEYAWSEGNYSCDCNRELLFENSIGNEPDKLRCTDGRFAVNIEDDNGEIIYSEFSNAVSIECVGIID